MMQPEVFEEYEGDFLEFDDIPGYSEDRKGFYINSESKIILDTYNHPEAIVIDMPLIKQLQHEWYSSFESDTESEYTSDSDDENDDGDDDNDDGGDDDNGDDDRDDGRDENNNHEGNGNGDGGDNGDNVDNYDNVEDENGNDHDQVNFNYQNQANAEAEADYGYGDGYDSGYDDPAPAERIFSRLLTEFKIGQRFEFMRRMRDEGFQFMSVLKEQQEAAQK